MSRRSFRFLCVRVCVHVCAVCRLHVCVQLQQRLEFRRTCENSSKVGTNPSNCLQLGSYMLLCTCWCCTSFSGVGRTGVAGAKNSTLQPPPRNGPSGPSLKSKTSKKTKKEDEEGCCSVRTACWAFFVHAFPFPHMFFCTFSHVR